jgi:arylsulfatase A-like enzyme
VSRPEPVARSGGQATRRRGALCMLTLASLLLLGARPNIVLITADTLRADHLGSYGYIRPTSPAIDALAEDGLLFENVHVTMSTTLPSHVSLMTSSYPARHGVLSNLGFFHQPLETSDSLRTAAQLLEAAGYRTAGFTSSSPLCAESGISAGFGTFVAPPSAVKTRERIDVPAGKTTDRVLEWLAVAESPFFLWVRYFDPHDPYEPPPEFNRFMTAEPALLKFLRERGFPEAAYPWAAVYGNLYDGEIHYMDSQIGRLLDRLKQMGLYDDALVVFTADHGEGLGQHAYPGHGQLWNEQVRAPLIVKFPKGERARTGRHPGLVSLIDLFPTLVAELELPIQTDEFDGIDVLRAQREFVLVQRDGREGVWPGDAYSLGSLEWKYLYATEAPDFLFHVATDPHETRNAIARYPGVRKRMKAQLLRMVEENRARSGLRRKDVPDEIREQLRKLGYAD